MSLTESYRRADRRLREWRRSRAWLWGIVYGGFVGSIHAVVLLGFGTSPVEALLSAGAFAVVFTGLTAWTTRPSAG